MDISKTIEPRSDQLNADDLVAGPITVKIINVTKGTPEQPVNIHLEGYDGRPFKPSLSMRRVLVAAWGTDAAAYIGRAMTLYRDSEVMFGKEKVGGIRISHLSNIAKAVELPLTISRGKRATYRVNPMTAADDHRDSRLHELYAALQWAGITDKESSLQVVSDITGRQVGASTELTDDEISQIISELHKDGKQ